MSEQKMKEGPTQKQKEFIEFLEKASNKRKEKEVTTMESMGFCNWSKCCWFIGSNVFAIKRD